MRRRDFIRVVAISFYISPFTGVARAAYLPKIWHCTMAALRKVSKTFVSR
jgi:hypothetical protein